MDQILIITNPYEFAQSTLEYGLKLAADLESEVRVLHVVDQKEEDWFPEHEKDEPYPESETYDEMLEHERVLRSEQLQQWISHYTTQINPQQPITLSVDVGFVKLVVRNYLKQTNISMILISQPNESGQNYGISLAQTTKIPVLICNPESKYVKPQNIIFGTSFDEKDIGVLSRLTNFASRFQANIQVVHVARKINYKEKLQAAGFQRHIQEKVDYNAIQFQSAESANPKKGLLSVAQNALGDIIVLARKKKNILQEIFSGHSIRHIVNTSDKPVLVYPLS